MTTADNSKQMRPALLEVLLGLVAAPTVYCSNVISNQSGSNYLCYWGAHSATGLFAFVSRTRRSDEVMGWKLEQSEEMPPLSQHVVAKTSKFCCSHETQSCKICGGCHSKHLSPGAHGKDHRQRGRVPSPIKTSNTLLVGLDGGNISTS